MEKAMTELVNEFKKNIPKDEEKLVDAFKDFLYTDLEKLKSTEKDISDDHIIERLKSITTFIMELDLNEKKQFFFIDENFERIIELSGKAYRNAVLLVKGEEMEDEFDFQKEKEELNSLLDSVEDYHKEQAQELVSEGLLDLLYLQNPDAKAVSLRLGREIRKKKEREDKE